MTHGGNVWQGEGPKHWLDYSANLRPEGAPEWVKSALLRNVDDARIHGGLDRPLDHQCVAVRNFYALELDVGAYGQLAAALVCRIAGSTCRSRRSTAGLVFPISSSCSSV